VGFGLIAFGRFASIGGRGSGRGGGRYSQGVVTLGSLRCQELTHLYAVRTGYFWNLLHTFFYFQTKSLLKLENLLR